MDPGRPASASGARAAACPARRGRARAPSGPTLAVVARRTPPLRPAAAAAAPRSFDSTPSAVSAARTVRRRRHARSAVPNARRTSAPAPMPSASAARAAEGSAAPITTAPTAANGTSQSRPAGPADELRADDDDDRGRGREPKLGIAPPRQHVALDRKPVGRDDAAQHDAGPPRRAPRGADRAPGPNAGEPARRQRSRARARAGPRTRFATALPPTRGRR